MPRVGLKASATETADEEKSTTTTATTTYYNYDNYNDFWVLVLYVFCVCCGLNKPIFSQKLRLGGSFPLSYFHYRQMVPEYYRIYSCTIQLQYKFLIEHRLTRY